MPPDANSQRQRSHPPRFTIKYDLPVLALPSSLRGLDLLSAERFRSHKPKRARDAAGIQNRSLRDDANLGKAGQRESGRRRAPGVPAQGAGQPGWR